MMHIAIHGHGGANHAIFLQSPNGHGHVVDHAESFAVIRGSVVKSAADVETDLVRHTLPRRQDRSAGSQPESIDQIARVGKLHFHRFSRAKCAGLQFLNVFGGVNQQDVFIGRRLGREKIVGIGNAHRDQAVMNAAIFFGREYVLPDRQVIVIAVNEFKGEHPSDLRLHSCCSVSNRAKEVTCTLAYFACLLSSARQRCLRRTHIQPPDFMAK